MNGKVAVFDQIIHMISSWESDFDQVQLVIPNDFPIKLYQQLTSVFANIDVKASTLFEERAIKSAEEIELIRTAQARNQKGFEHVFDVLKKATIAKDGTLHWNGSVLTSEILQGEMNAVHAKNGALSFNDGPIMACGAQGADPHNTGSGPLKAGEFIIIDSFPLASNFYNGDLTRTVLKGEPTDWHLKVYEAVKASQQHALDIAKAGVTGAFIHEETDKVLIQHGFTTGQDENGNHYGFFHGTGHALGLDVHDAGPGVSPRNTDPLKENMVVTIEPGLYYPEKGGVRIEDIVAVTKNGIDNLTTLPKQLLVDKF
jgi:Xaa-Pro aminopeptidase